MMKKTIATLLVAGLLAVPTIRAQETEIKITLSEQFFEALLEAVFENLGQPKVPISLGAGVDKNSGESESVKNGVIDKDAVFRTASHSTQDSALGTRYSVPGTPGGACDETVRLKKEVDGVHTAVKFRRGGIIAPIAFEGNYNPPLIGCIGFSGWAETTIDLSFDKNKNALIGNARVLNVNLSGTNGIGGSIITRLVQNSIDRKINPLEIVKLDMLSFTAPIQNSGKLRMEAIGIRHVVGEGELDVYLKYRFRKPDKK